MTSPGNSKTPPTRASRRSNRPKARTTPPSPGPTAPASEPSSLSSSGEGPGRGQSDAAGKRVVLAAIIGPHGVAGEVRLKLFTDDLGRYKAFNGGALTLKVIRDGGNGAIARFAEIPDRTAAERFRGTELTVLRDELPPLEEGEYYHADLIGLPCGTDTGEPVGRVVAVENFGAGDILEIEKPDGKRFMVPVAAAQIGDHVTLDPAFVE